jgi:hypothetical protein
MPVPCEGESLNNLVEQKTPEEFRRDAIAKLEWFGERLRELSKQ